MASSSTLAGSARLIFIRTSLCSELWMPEDGAYFCSKACVIEHNNELQRTFDEAQDELDEDERELLCDDGPELLPLRRRPDADIEVAVPLAGVKVISSHTGKAWEDG